MNSIDLIFLFVIAGIHIMLKKIFQIDQPLSVFFDNSQSISVIFI